MRPSGGYRDLRSFQIATIIYDATCRFCEQFIDPRSRTRDQMVQAARSGRQNIAEGSRAAATSSHTELRLVNVARASLEELLLDYEDFLRHCRLPQWHPESAEALAVRRVRNDRSDRTDRPDQTDQVEQASTRIADERRAAQYAYWLDSPEPAARANALICLIHQANTLLDRQIASLERQFVVEGGYSEQLAAARMAERDRKRHARAERAGQSDQPAQADVSGHIPPCPRCGKPMALRTARQGQNVGRQFWGCSAYPDCTGVIRV
jgi:four helix bundle suffix protein